MKNKKTMKKIFSIVLAFILYICISCLIFSFIMKISIFNSDFIKQSIDKSGYINYCIEYAENSLVSHGMASGFDEEFFTTILEEKRVENDVKKSIDSMFGKEVSPSDFEEYLYKNLVQNVKNRGLTITEENDESLKHLAKICNEEYENSFKIPGDDIIKSILPNLNTAILIFIIILVIVSIICVVLIYFLQKRRNYYKFYIYSLTATMGTILIPVLLIEYQNRIKNLGIDDKGLYYLINNMSTSIIGYFHGAVLIILALIIFCVFLNYKRKHK